MKYHLTCLSFLLTAFLLFSCETEQKETSTTDPKEVKDTVVVDQYEQFEALDITEFSKKVENSNEVLTPKDIMKLYYPRQVESEEGNQTINIDVKDLGKAHAVVTLIHDNLLDDSMKALQVVMRLQKKGDKWSVVSLQKNWKCREGRGHTDWGIKLCN